ncbi:sulfate ABC transporter permease subunit CysT [Clostridium cylindrosporum]|uniref:Sulfate transport system permease protein CysT n=1 Tax=Clostridium cylindrosporum DSM 605 TaxID=1121307 RepID=A0A0J8D450_CLOCY|nr:sulfate ABC transporter permease subunit CysT [Clostridium cylindrosporum]KMT20955.1 sulfate transport system permease protein CysT [Clostridium cylindrosporum DSM 605]
MNTVVKKKNNKLLKGYTIIPGFGLSLGFTVSYISILVLLPLSMIFINSLNIGMSDILKILSEPRVISAFKVSFLAAFLAAGLNAVFGFLIAWVIVRYNFFGKKIIDSLIDLPFALPTAVAGITLTTLYAQDGWIGKYLSIFGIKVSFTFLGIVVALSFISIPFVVRTVQPVIENLDKEVEEAARSLGSNSFITFVKVIIPEVFPALLTGFSLAFARAVGEYGSVVFISGNMPMKTEIAPLIIMTKMEQYDYEGATVIAGAMLVISFVAMLIINLLQWYTSSYHKAR